MNAYRISQRFWALFRRVDVRPRARSRGPHGHGSDRREHSGASGARELFGPSGQQLLLSCEAIALCVGLLLSVGGCDGACDDELRGWNLPGGR